jgi:hypothetical protein
MAVRGAEARGCCNCMPAHSILASVGKGKGESHRGGGGLARPWPEEGDWGGWRWEMAPTGGSRLSMSVRGRGEAGRLSWAAGERLGRKACCGCGLKKGKREGDRWAGGEAWAAAEFKERR